jgi:hypothetical protein
MIQTKSLYLLYFSSNIFFTVLFAPPGLSEPSFLVSIFGPLQEASLG